MLSEMQAKAVNEFNNNVLLLAKAGTGKTYTVAQKIVKAEKLGIKAEEILCLTFTVKAATELRDDIAAYCGNFHPEVFTIHGFCYKLMLEYGRKTGRFSDKQIADEIDEGEIIKSILNEYIANGEYKTPDETVPVSAKNLVKAISMIKHRRAESGANHFSPTGYGAAIRSLLNNKEFTDCFVVKKNSVKYTDENLIALFNEKGTELMEKYRFVLDSSALCDFDDLIFSVKSVISDINYQKPVYKLIIIDEMQDTSLAEYDVMKSFFNDAIVMLCGDEYQTIYGWRGSKPFEIIENFKNEYNAITIRLDKNRRSTPVLSYASAYFLNSALNANIPLNEDDVKNLSDDQKIEIIGCENEDGEAREIFRQVLSGDVPLNETCVMARTNAYIADLYKKLQTLNDELPPDEKLSFFTADTHSQFYKKPVIKDFLAFFKLLVNADDEASLLRLSTKQIAALTPHIIAALKDYSSVGISVGHFLRDETYMYGDYYKPLLNAYKENKIVVYDLETTGLDLDRDEAIQISAIKFGEKGETEQFNRFIIPTREIKTAALSVHGYGEDYIIKHGGAKAQTVLSDFATFANGCVLVGHNSSSFDDIMLKRQLNEHKITLNKNGEYDTLKIAAVFKPQTPDYKLSSLCEYFNVTNERAHDAFSDVSATKKILEVFINAYISPTLTARKTIIGRYAPLFEEFYRQISFLKSCLSEGNFLLLIKEISKISNITKSNSPTHITESVNDLYRALKQYAEKSEPTTALKAFLRDVSLSSSQMDVLVKKFNKIPLITIHQSKGCEFKKVILVGVGEKEFPSLKAMLSGDDEEEKRVFYVALTRAKQKLVITYPKYKFFADAQFKRQPSPYLSFLPSSCTVLKQK